LGLFLLGLGVLASITGVVFLLITSLRAAISVLLLLAALALLIANSAPILVGAKPTGHFTTVEIIPASGPGITPSHPPTEAGIVTRWLQNYWVRRSAMQETARRHADRGANQASVPQFTTRCAWPWRPARCAGQTWGHQAPAGSAGIRSPQPRASRTGDTAEEFVGRDVRDIP
jgi:hypothetical protein